MNGSSKSHLNLELIEELRAFQIPGEPDMIREIVKILLDTTPLKITLLENHLQSDHIEAVGSEAHSLKSSALSLGAEQLGALCQAIETAAGEGRPLAGVKPLLALLLQQMRDEWTIVERELLLLVRPS